MRARRGRRRYSPHIGVEPRRRAHRGGERCSWQRRRSRTSTASCEIFSTKGAEKRRQHGSKGASVFRDPNEDDRVWVIFDWDAEGWQSFVSDPEVPPIMQEAGHKGRPQVGGARRPLRRLGASRSEERHASINGIRRPIKVGVITDQTGPLSFMGIANANVARMVIDDINAARRPARAGRSSCTSRTARPTDSVAEAAAAKLVQQDQRRRDLRRHLQLDAAGHQGPGRRGGQDALHLPGAVRGAGVRPADLLHRPGAGAAGRAAHPVADAADRARRRSTCRRPTTSGRTC